MKSSQVNFRRQLCFFPLQRTLGKSHSPASATSLYNNDPRQVTASADASRRRGAELVAEEERDCHHRRPASSPPRTAGIAAQDEPASTGPFRDGRQSTACEEDGCWRVS